TRPPAPVVGRTMRIQVPGEARCRGFERWQNGPVEEAALRRRLEQDGYSVYGWSDPPGTTYPPHAHGTDQSHWVLRGALALTVDGEEYVLRPGDRDWLPA